MRFTVLNRNGEFRALYHRGKSQVHSALVTYVRRNRYGFPRVGITTGKKVGGAVQRNRCRRIIREAYRALLPRIQSGLSPHQEATPPPQGRQRHGQSGWDIVFVARQRTVHLKSTQIQRVMEAQLTALGVLKR